jgi:8-oxo-dGTP pyrophosphatase MutT (NUDIX family)
MLRQLENATRFDAAAYTPLFHGTDRIGWVEPGFAGALTRFPQAFACADDAVRIISTAHLDAAVRALTSEGCIAGWRNEPYEVVSHSRGETLFTLERAAFRRFGLQARSVHLNGWVRAGDGCRLWIARRSATKQIDPGMLDNVVAGGITAGSSPLQTLLRECGEEAGMTGELARNAVPSGSFQVLRSVDDGVNHEVIHVFDLELPADFAPVNRDGEVGQFMLMSTDEAGSRIESDLFTVDAAAATIDFLWRRGLLRDQRIGTALAALRSEVRAQDQA